ncbi:hypothetical protein RSAG8_08541, partial [Rhizoctonia solani AG-8 WAC10335]
MISFSAHTCACGPDRPQGKHSHQSPKFRHGTLPINSCCLFSKKQPLNGGAVAMKHQRYGRRITVR